MASEPIRRRQWQSSITLGWLAAALHWAGVWALLLLVLWLIA